jgi:hypothetical protein
MASTGKFFSLSKNLASPFSFAIEAKDYTEAKDDRKTKLNAQKGINSSMSSVLIKMKDFL